MTAEKNDIAALLVRAIHLGFIAWMIYAPFSGIDEFLVLHVIIVPFLMLHWLTSSSGCFLTLLEKNMRGLGTDNESFIHSIVAPIYVIDDASLKYVVMAATLGLWAVSLRRVSWATFKKTLSNS
jgi:hypothetical protein